MLLLSLKTTPKVLAFHLQIVVNQINIFRSNNYTVICYCSISFSYVQVMFYAAYFLTQLIS